MSLLQGDLAEGVGGLRLGWAGAYRVANRNVGTQLAVGVVLGLLYLAVVALSIGQAAFLLIAAAAAIALVWPGVGLATLALILPMREPDLFQPLYVVSIVLGSTAFGCLLRLPGDPHELPVRPAIVLAVGYAVYTVISVVPTVSGYPVAWAPTAALEALRIVSGLGIFLVAGYLFRSIPWRPVIAIALLGASLAAVLALLPFWHIGPLGSLAGLLNPQATDRASGGFSNANYLGFLAAQASLLAMGCWSITPPRYRPLLAVALASLVTATVVSFSRSAYIGTVVGVLVLALLRSRRIALVVAIVAAILAVVLYPTFLEARLAGNEVLDPSVIAARAQSENWRSLAFAAGISIFLTEPIFGVGYGVFQHLSPPYIGASPATFSHDAYVQILAEQGLVGVLMVATVLVSLAVSLVRSSHPLRSAGIAMGCGYLVQSFFINSTTSIQISGLLCLTLAAALSAIPDRPVERAEET